jgi:hypothetical protein
MKARRTMSKTIFCPECQHSIKDHSDSMGCDFPLEEDEICECEMTAEKIELIHLREENKKLKRALRAFLYYHEGDYEDIPEVKRAKKVLEITK